MANSRKEALNKLKKKRGVKFTSPYSKSNKNKNTLQNQVANYEERLAKSGINPDDITDKRNWLEKTLNLEKDQNVLFDIFEILDRPRNALATGVKNVLDGDSFLTGLGEGILGESKTSTKDILVDNFGMEDEKGKLDWSDALGFVGDIATDPLDWVLIPASGGLSLVGNVVDTAGDVAKAVKTASKVANVVDTAGDVAKAVKTASKVANVVDTAGDVAKGIKTADKVRDVAKAIFYNGGKNFTSASNILARAVGEGVKGTAKQADNLITKALTKIDDVNLNRARKVANDLGISIEDAARSLNLGLDKAQIYKNLKTDLQRTLDSAKNVSGLVGKSREAGNISGLEQKVGKETAQQIREQATRIAKKMDGNINENTTTILNNLTDAIESTDDWSLKGSDVVKAFKKGTTADFYTAEQASAVQKALRNYGIESTIQEGGRKLKLDAPINKLYEVQDALNDVTFGEKMSKETREQLNNARKYFEQSDDLRSIYNNAISASSKQARLSDSIRGLNTESITRPGYIRHNLNEDVRRSKDKSFITRGYDAPIAEVNAIKKAELEKAAGAQSKRLEKAKSSIYKTTDEGEIILDKAGKPVRDDNLYKTLVENKKTKIKRIQDEIASAKEIRKLDITSEDVKNLAKEAGMTPEEFRASFDADKLTKKGEKAYDIIKKNPELRQTVEEIESINFADINPEHIDVVDTLRTDFRDYAKTQTIYKNALKKGKDDLADIVKTKKKIVTADIKVAKNFADKEPAKVLKEANRAFKQGSKQNEALMKAQSKLEKNQKQIASIFQSAEETVSKLKAQLNYEMESLKKLEGSADAIFNKKLKTIDESSKAAATLSDEAAKDFFVRDFSMNFIDYVNNQSTWNKGAQVFNDALVTGVFSNDYVKIADEIADGKIPHNFTKVNGNSLVKKLDTYKGVLPANSQAYANVINRFADKTLYMDKDLANILDISRNTLTNQISPLAKVWDGINNTFKKFSTLTPGFHIRNMVGNSVNMVMSGMPSAQLPVYWKKAHSLWNRADDLVRKAVDGTLTAAEAKDFAILEDFYKAGFADNVFKKVQGLDTIKETKGLLSKASQIGVKGNEVVDRYNRLALLMYAKENSKYVQKLGKSNAIDAVRFALFDPSNMSAFEQNVMKRIMPFYTFTKQNLMFQAENLLKNTPKYNRLYKFMRDAYADVGEDSYYDYQKNGMQIPLPITDDEGNQLFLKANLPISDLGEWLENPLQRTVSATAPAMKLPYEMVTGVNTFTGEPNYYKTGENFANALGITLPKGVSDAASTAEHILTGLGMQNVSSNVLRKVTALIEGYNGDLSGQQLWAELFRSIIQNTNEENVQNAGLYEDLEAYQNYISEAERQGVDIPTLTEINKANQMKLNRMKRKRTMS